MSQVVKQVEITCHGLKKIYDYSFYLCTLNFDPDLPSKGNLLRLPLRKHRLKESMNLARICVEIEVLLFCGI